MNRRTVDVAFSDADSEINYIFKSVRSQRPDRFNE